MTPVGHLEQLAVGRPQGDEGHLAGVGVDLLHQQGELGRAVFPVLYLNLNIKSTYQSLMPKKIH